MWLKSPRIVTAAALAVALASLSLAPPSSILASRSTTSPSPGSWSRLSKAQESTTAAMLRTSNGHNLIAWQVHPRLKFSYDLAELSPTGGLAVGTKDIFAGHDWTGNSGTPVLLMDGGKPLIVFSGQESLSGKYSNGCVVGALRSGSTWVLQPWTLSLGCTFANVGFGGATITKTGVLSADWGGGTLNYRVGASPSIPATTPDKEIKTSGDTEFTSEVDDISGNGDVYGGWDQFFSRPASADGVYIEDLSKGSGEKHAPDSGTSTTSHPTEALAMASPSSRPGVFVAYCSNSSKCTRIDLWKYGAAKPMAVPKSSGGQMVALSAGADGRLWLAWFAPATARVSTVRTNKAATAFGPVESYPVPAGCATDGNATVGISSGSAQRLDVAVICYDYNASGSGTHISVTQSEAGLAISPPVAFISHKRGGSVTYHVLDAGDAVPGATVVVDERSGKTNGNGAITFKFPKGARVGIFKAIASMSDYYSATGSLKVG